MAGRTDPTASVNRQIKVANERHEKALARQAARLVPSVQHAQDAVALLYVEAQADLVVGVVAVALRTHHMDRYRAAMAGKQVDSPLPSGRPLLSEKELSIYLEGTTGSVKCGRYFDLTGVSFTELVNQRLAAAAERGLIPPCHYDRWEIVLGPQLVD